MRSGQRRSGGASGFTILEILLALALIGLMATVFIGASASLLADKEPPPDDQFWSVVNEARKAALDQGTDQSVSFDGKTRAWIVDSGDGQVRSFPLKGPEDLVFEFLSTSKDASAILLGGTLVQTQTIASVTFYSDGTCSPFRGQFRTRTGAHQLSVDPWTCAAMLPPPGTAS